MPRSECLAPTVPLRRDDSVRAFKLYHSADFNGAIGANSNDDTSGPFIYQYMSAQKKL
jgi:hypothetical protein